MKKLFKWGLFTLTGKYFVWELYGKSRFSRKDYGVVRHRIKTYEVSCPQEKSYLGHDISFALIRCHTTPESFLENWYFERTMAHTKHCGMGKSFPFAQEHPCNAECRQKENKSFQKRNFHNLEVFKRNLFKRLN